MQEFYCKVNETPGKVEKPLILNGEELKGGYYKDQHLRRIIYLAKAEVAEDIGGLICCLAGNLMLEDKEAGTLLANQLQPLVDTIKARYLPHLPRKGKLVSE
jgi:hypothetical protein